MWALEELCPSLDSTTPSRVTASATPTGVTPLGPRRPLRPPVCHSVPVVPCLGGGPSLETQLCSSIHTGTSVSESFAAKFALPAGRVGYVGGGDFPRMAGRFLIMTWALSQ